MFNKIAASLYRPVFLVSALAIASGLTGCGGFAPITAFRASPSGGEAPLTVQFTDMSLPGDGDITAWVWDFGDGTTSTEQNPTHTYTANGTYDVALTASNRIGDTAYSIENYIRVGLSFQVSIVNNSAFDLADAYVFDAGATSDGPDLLNVTLAPGESRDLPTVFTKGSQIVAVRVRLDSGELVPVYLPGNLDSLELVGNHVTITVTGDTRETLAIATAFAKR